MAKEPAIIAVFVEGGNVTSIMSDDPDIVVIMVDYDNIREGAPEPEVPDTLEFEIY